MLNSSIVGAQIARLRKTNGYTQDKLAAMLHVSPQAVSKWENGHALPETSLLPVLSDIFTCTIDQILMPGYVTDENLINERNAEIERQAELIAKKVIKNMEAMGMDKTNFGLQNEDILEILSKVNPSLYSNNVKVKRSSPRKTQRSVNTIITVTTDSKAYSFIEKVLFSNKRELHNINLLKGYTLPIPQVYHLDIDKGISLTEGLSIGFIQGFDFDEQTENGKFIRANYISYLEAAADFHSAFWEDETLFEKVGLPWHLDNFQIHIKGVEKDYIKYKEEFKDKINPSDMQCLDNALSYLKDSYINIINNRFHTGKNITLIHGDLHPGNTFISPTNKAVKFIDFEAVRIGLCTDDLAMFVAYHIAPDKKDALPLLNHYYKHLSIKVAGYSYENFMSDYKASIIENIFFSIHLINQGIPAFNIRDASLIAYRTFASEV
jgi:transcriptional regulator with XRE-family HTH domain/aminoglycoside/choline kinase family phosphotransferase